MKRLIVDWVIPVAFDLGGFFAARSGQIEWLGLLMGVMLLYCIGVIAWAIYKKKRKKSTDEPEGVG